MVRYLRKREGLGEEAAVMEKAARKRKAATVEAQLSTSSSQLKTRRVETLPENSTTCEAADHDASASCCSSSGSSELTERSSKFVDPEENEVAPEFCGTSVGDSLDCRNRILADRRMTMSYFLRRETSTPMTESQADAADEMESAARPRESTYRRRSAPEKMPSEDELEAFFAAAEKNIQKQFTEKYNYDIVKDLPLEGRYEWVEVQENP